MKSREGMEYVAAAQEAARKAGAMLKENMGKAREIVYKGAVNIVTNFDERSQEIIYQHLSSRFPDHDFLAEEDLHQKRGSDFCWIIDPIDGTTNYAHNFPVFCVSIALASREEIKAGVIYDPLREEMFSALQGGGAFLNGEKIAVSGVTELQKSLLATGFPYDVWESQENNLNHFANFITRAQAVRRCGSAAIDLCYIACGRFDGFWELKLNPWDIAAGALMVTEAGGIMSDFRGDPFSIYGDESLASNGLIHEQMIQVLQLSEKKAKHRGDGDE